MAANIRELHKTLKLYANNFLKTLNEAQRECHQFEKNVKSKKSNHGKH